MKLSIKLMTVRPAIAILIIIAALVVPSFMTEQDGGLAKGSQTNAKLGLKLQDDGNWQEMGKAVFIKADTATAMIARFQGLKRSRRKL